MGAIGGLFGSAGGASGTGFSAPAQAQITNPTNLQQIGAAYTGANSAMNSQQQLLQALQAQQGIQNQSNVYNQLQGIANGTGPNPAQAMLNQATGQNVAAQGALMAGQRGASANPALIARQAAMQGANIQQQAVGQGATMQAQQALGAIGQAGQIAGAQAGNQIGQTNANAQAQQAEQAQLLGAQQAYNQAQTSSQASVNAGNAALAQTQMQGQQSIVGGIGNAIGATTGLARGGEVKNMADGGDTSAFQGPQSRFGQFLQNQTAPSGGNAIPLASFQGGGQGSKDLQAGISKAGQGLYNALKSKSATAPVDQNYSQVPGANGLMGGTGAPAAPDPYSQTPGAGGLTSGATPPMSMDIENNAMGGNVGSKLKKGGKVPGKAPVPGPVNDYRNDVVDAKLSPGEIVIPNAITKGPNPIQGAAKFVAQEMAKRKGKK